MTYKSKSSPRRDAVFAALVIGAVLLALLCKTWRRWPDLTVDFGAQLYIPWQLSTGAVLYRDVHYLVGGPLSQYYHALLFKIFGVSFLTVVVSNLAVLVIILTLIYACFYKCADQLTAVTACVAVLVVFAFAHYTTLGIFNYITPYCAEIVHGLLLSMMAVALLARWFEKERPSLAAAAGFCLGLTFLTKPDLFLALMITTVCSAAVFWTAKRKGSLLGRSLATMAGAATVPIAAFFLWFLPVENVEQSLRSVFAAWIPLLTTPAAHSAFYKWCVGLDSPWVHLKQILIQTLCLACIMSVCAAICWRRIPEKPAWLLGMVLAIPLIKISWDFNWFACGYCLPPLCVALTAMLVWRALRNGWEPSLVFALLWAIWSLAMLAKMGVFCRIWHYGFVLAMPAFVSGLYFLLWVVPQQLQRWNMRPALFQTLLWMMLLPGLLKLTNSYLQIYGHKDLPVGSGRDLIMGFDPHVSPKGAAMLEALQWVQTHVPQGGTLTVLPQGVMLNYLARRPNPCGYSAWNPPEMAAFGQETMTRAFIEHSPDYVIEILVDYGEYDEPVFGKEKRFGLGVRQWIDAHYKPEYLIGHDWLKDGQFGIKILKRVDEVSRRGAEGAEKK